LAKALKLSVKVDQDETKFILGLFDWQQMCLDSMSSSRTGKDEDEFISKRDDALSRVKELAKCFFDQHGEFWDYVDANNLRKHL